MERIELSQAQVQNMMSNGNGLTWARKAVAKQELSEEEKAFGMKIGEEVEKAYKYGSPTAHIAQIIVEMIEPEIFDVPLELLGQIFDEGSLGEFDDVKYESKWINGLVARETAIRTGSVEKSYLGLMDATKEMTNLEIATEFPMSELRKPNGLGVAELTLNALEAFNNAKYRFMLNFVESKVIPTDNKFTGAITAGALDDFFGCLYDNNDSTGYSQVVGLSNVIRSASKTTKDGNMFSENMKDILNNDAKLQVLDNAVLVPIKAGRKDGNGQTLIPDKKLYGFSGKVGKSVTRGDIRVYLDQNNSNETFSVHFKGVEFGVAVYPDQARKIAVFTDSTV